MRWIPATVVLASAVLATVPYTFPAGVPAKASQVNRNFEALDSALASQNERLNWLRHQFAAQADSLKAELAALRQAKAEAPVAEAPKGLELPLGTVIGLLTVPGPDGFLPGSDNSWQSVESYGAIDGLPTVASAQPPVVVAPATVDTSKVPADTTAPAVAVAAAAPSKPQLRWYVKVK